MPRRDWNAKLEREYERLDKHQARARMARFGRTRPVRALPAGSRRPRPSPGTRGSA
jgi:hypothetical protein